VFLFYWNTGIANHTEADDAFEYASMVETQNHEWLYHPHHLLYGVSTKAIYNGLQALGYGGRAYSLLAFLSSLSAAGAVFLFFRFCYRRYSMRPVSSMFAAGLLALSYGFWRYANEAEVILPAGFFVLWAVFLATAPQLRTGQVVIAALISGVSVLFHVLNGVPVFLALPLFYLLKKEPRHACVHMMIAGSVVLAAYLLVFSLEPDKIFNKGVPFVASHLEWSFLIKGVIGLGQCVVSGNFLFGFEWFAQKMGELFPYRMLAEEAYMGRHMSMLYRIVPVITLSLLLVAVGYGLFRAISSWRNAFRTDRMKVMLMVGGWQTIVVIGLWFVVYASAILFLEPGNPEVWVLGLIPFWLLVCGLVISPIARANELWVVLAMLVFLGLHNYFGGIGILKNPETDYNIQKAKWVLGHAKKSDLIMTAENPVFVRYLKYSSSATVADLNQSEPDELAEQIDSAEQVFVFNDVFEYPASMRVRFPSMAERVDRYAAEFLPHSRKLSDNDFGGVWELMRDAPLLSN